jgi:hypothetical protein
MAIKDEPCRQCQSFDWYLKGDFAYCRTCHREASKRHIENKRLGITPETKGPPSRSLEHLLKHGGKGRKNLKAFCVNNHPLSGDNVRLDSQQGRLLRRCRACERNAKRRTYGLAPEPSPTTLTAIMLDSQDDDELG